MENRNENKMIISKKEERQRKKMMKNKKGAKEKEHIPKSNMLPLVVKTEPHPFNWNLTSMDL